MARRKQPAEPAAEPPEGGQGGQVNFRAHAELWDRLTQVAHALGLDMANLARMIVVENLPTYEERAKQARRRLDPDDCGGGAH